MNIWVKYMNTGKIAKVDTCKKSSADYLVGEYQLCCGPGCLVWAGRKCDVPSRFVTRSELEYIKDHNVKNMPR